MYLLPVTVLALACLNIELPLLDKSFLKFFSVEDDLAPQLLLLLFLFLKEDCILTVDDCSTHTHKQREIEGGNQQKCQEQLFNMTVQSSSSRRYSTRYGNLHEDIMGLAAVHLDYPIISRLLWLEDRAK